MCVNRKTFERKIEVKINNKAYIIEKTERLPDIKTEGILLRHIKSGARVALLPNYDENKVFLIGFKTPPSDSTGVAHIIEHTVLCGSRRYPLRDPFMQLVKGSLNTFLNAMTFSDKTVYPAASCNEKDFKNLMNVYLDAVFYPNIYKYHEIFMQEGWRYELKAKDDELKINGIVYSEMKGDMSSPDSAVFDYISEAMFPDTPYGVNSGGDPEKIPTLTYEDYLEFHKKYYHPSNSYIVLYGNVDMEERLSWLDENYLSAFDKKDIDAFIPKQTHFGDRKPRVSEKKYSIAKDDDPNGKAYFALSFLCGESRDHLECRAMKLLSEVLVNRDGAPVREALLDAGIGDDIYAEYDTHMLEFPFSVIAKNVNEEDEKKFCDIVLDTFAKEAERGIDEKALLASLNRLEFKFREGECDGDPRGLDFALCMMQSWLYDDKCAFDYLHFLDDYADLKKRIGSGYFEELIKKYILSSDHSVLVKLMPEAGLVEKKDEELKVKLAEYKKTLTDEEIEKLIRETKALEEYQKHEATKEELDMLPSLERSDISRFGVPFYNEERTIGGAHGVFHNIDTNGITYLKLFFDISDLPEKYIPYAGLLASVLSRMDTNFHTYAELNTEIKLNTGCLDFVYSVIGKYGKSGEYTPLYGIYMKVMPENVKFALDCAREIITSTKFEDKKRLHDIITEIRSDKKREFVSSGHAVAVTRARSYHSAADAYLQRLCGVDFYFFICELCDSFDIKYADIADSLDKVAKTIFNPAKMTVSLAADRAGCEEVEKYLPVFEAELNKTKRTCLGNRAAILPEKKNEGFMIPSGVQYLGRDGNIVKAGVKYTGALQVARTAVNCEYLYNNIRVRGGAYGCGSGFSSDSGNGYFLSFRDPKLAETDEIYKKTGEYLRRLVLDEKELTKYVIGTMAAYERPMSPAEKIIRSFRAYLSGKKYEDVNRERGEILDVTAEEIRNCADAYDAIISSGCICAVGNGEVVKKNSEMFDSLITIN